MMTNSENLRDIVCDLLLEIEREQAPSHVAIRRMLEKYQYLGSGERGFISRLTRGTLERRMTLDWMIDRFSSVRVKKMKPVIRTILRMSVYQIKYMDGVPESAVCNEAVKLAKKRGFKNLSGFVNGILRNMIRNPEKSKLPEDNLSIYYSQPEWLVDYWTECYGRENTIKMFQWFLEERPLTVRLCKHRLPPEDFIRRMEAQGVTAVQSTLVQEAFSLKGLNYLGALMEFREGICTVQDVSSMLVAKAAGVKPTDRVIDVCAAPGGKSIQISELLTGGGRIISRDLTESKVALIEENIQRMNADHIQAECQDALVYVPEDKEMADVVIADLPCSGLGVIGRKADIKYRVNREDIATLAKLQRDILTVVSDYVKPGGCLIYSTCTVNPEENEENVRWFQEHFPFETESLKKFLPEGISSNTIDQGYIQLMPGEYGTDGFFIARFRRRWIMKKTDIRSMTLDELEHFVTDGLGDKKFRARQIYDWMHVKLVQSFDEMTNLSKNLRERLKCEATLYPVTMVDRLVSNIDGTRKYLFRMEDGSVIESVLMKYKHGNSVCISSQVGCRMGCRFCASTLLGLERDLTAAEMLGQVYAIQKESGERVSNVVIMGTGEPLDNYDAAVRFIRMISDDKGLNISQRNITLSTCGLVPEIYRLADEHLQMTLAISLHASNDEKRKSMMPIANKYSIEELLKACRYYYDTNGRRLTFEYSLAGGVNDSPEDVRALAHLLKGFMWHVNLIPINPVEERDYIQSDRKSIVNFKNNLEKYGGNVTIRREMGRDIQAACGQLRRRYMTQTGKKEV